MHRRVVFVSRISFSSSHPSPSWLLFCPGVHCRFCGLIYAPQSYPMISIFSSSLSLSLLFFPLLCLSYFVLFFLFFLFFSFSFPFSFSFAFPSPSLSIPSPLSLPLPFSFLSPSPFPFPFLSPSPPSLFTPWAGRIRHPRSHEMLKKEARARGSCLEPRTHFVWLFKDDTFVLS